MLAWLFFIACAVALSYPALPRDVKGYAAVIVLVLWISTSIPAVILGALVVTLRRNARLDRVFADLGPGRAIAPVARAWACLVDGREVNVWFSKGPQLEVYVSARPRTNAAVAQPNALSTFALGMIGRETAPVPHGLQATATDADWMARFVDAPQVSEALRTLLPHGGGLRSVLIMPDAVKFTWRGFDLAELTPASVTSVVDTVELLASAADRIGSPASPVAPGGVASRLRTSRGSLGSFFGITFGCMSALLVFIAVMTTVIMLVSGP